MLQINVGKIRVLIHEYFHLLATLHFKYPFFIWGISTGVGDTSWSTDISCPGLVGETGF